MKNKCNQNQDSKPKLFHVNQKLSKCVSWFFGISLPIPIELWREAETMEIISLIFFLLFWLIRLNCYVNLLMDINTMCFGIMFILGGFSVASSFAARSIQFSSTQRFIWIILWKGITLNGIIEYTAAVKSYLRMSLFVPRIIHTSIFI